MIRPNPAPRNSHRNKRSTSAKKQKNLILTKAKSGASRNVQWKNEKFSRHGRQVHLTADIPARLPWQRMLFLIRYRHFNREPA